MRQTPSDPSPRRRPHGRPRTGRAALLSAAVLAAVPAACSIGTTRVATAENTFLGHSTGEVSARLVEEQDLPTEAPVLPPPVTHGTASRERSTQLERDVDEILALTLPQVRSLQAELEDALTKYPAPEKLATNQPGLVHWREELRTQHREKVARACDETQRRLSLMHTLAMDAAVEQARLLSPPKAPIDAGQTGDGALDSVLDQFSEVLDGALNAQDLEVQCSQQASKVVELFEVFNSFALKDPDGETAAEDRMQGRLLLFVGGDETGAAPRALFAFRDHAGSEPRTNVVAQVTRHRILRGRTIVKDYGWRAAPVKGSPGLPQTETLENYLIAPAVEPVLNRAADAYEQLRDLRVQIDVQTGVFEQDGTPIGGIDWRIEFSVSARGDLTWQLESGKPVYDPYCAEIQKVMSLGG
jgi:hypothetical protein